MECPKCGAPLEGNVCPYCGHINEEEKANVTIVNNIYRDNTSTYPAKMNQNLIPPVKKKRPLAIVIISIIIFVFVVIPLIGHNARNSQKGDNIVHSQNDTFVQIDTVTELTTTPVEDYKITYQNCVIYRNILGSIDCDFVIEVENTGTSDLYLDNADIEFEDNSGNLLAKFSGIVSSDPEIISTGEKGYFYCNFGSLVGTIDENSDYVFSPKIKLEKSKKQKIRYDISDLSIFEGDNLSSVNVIGRVTNNTNEDDSLVWICCVLYGTDGIPIAVSGTNVLDLKAGETKSFDIQDIKFGNSNIELSDITNYKVYACKT